MKIMSIYVKDCKSKHFIILLSILCLCLHIFVRCFVLSVSPHTTRSPAIAERVSGCSGVRGVEIGNPATSHDCTCAACAKESHSACFVQSHLSSRISVKK